MCRVNKTYKMSIIATYVLHTQAIKSIGCLPSQPNLRTFNSIINDPDLASALRVVNANSKDALSNYTRSPVSILTTNISEILHSQPSIRNARNVFHIGTEPESIDATCLSNLTRVAATFSWLPYIVTGRLISEVTVVGDISHKRSIDLNFFTPGTAPIQNLVID
jgi:hypothetical protein